VICNSSEPFIAIDTMAFEQWLKFVMSLKFFKTMWNGA